MNKAYKKKNCPKCHKQFSYYNFTRIHEPKCQGDKLELKVRQKVMK